MKAKDQKMSVKIEQVDLLSDELSYEDEDNISNSVSVSMKTEIVQLDRLRDDLPYDEDHEANY